MGVYVSSTDMPAIMKKKWSKRKKIIGSIILLLIAIISVILYVIPTANPWYIVTVKDSNATATTWTVTDITVGYSILKSEVYVQIKNASGTFIINSELLSTVSGTHGFNYVAVSQGIYISIGDVFSLSKDYSTGSVLRILAVEGIWCELTV